MRGSYGVYAMTVVERGAHDIVIDSSMVEGCNFEPELVRSRAEDIRHAGVVVFPVVRARTSEVIAGHITIAACLLLGRSVCRCNLIDCTNAEAKMLKAKHANTSGIDADQAMLETIYEFQKEEVGGTHGKARGAKQRAIERYAANMGLTVEQARDKVKAVERRLRHKRFMLEDRYAESPVEDWGRALDRDFIITLYHTLDRFRHVKSLLTQLSRVLEAMQEDAQTRLPQSRYEMLHKPIEKLQRLVHASQPVAVCPACAGEDEGGRRKCVRCLGVGYATHANIDDYPEEMKVVR